MVSTSLFKKQDNHIQSQFGTFCRFFQLCVCGGGGGEGWGRYCQISFVYETKTFDAPGRENGTKNHCKKEEKKFSGRERDR